MKQLFFKALLLLVTLVEVEVLFAQADVNTEFTDRTNYVFG